MPDRSPSGRSVDPDEVAHFGTLAADWWNPDGTFRALHRLNPARLGYIRDQACAHFGRDAASDKPFEGLRVLDIGCGGGLLCEPLARLGAGVVGIDASARAIEVARRHAAEMDLDIDYRNAAAEDLAAAGEAFDVVLNMEVVEHVANLQSFIDASCAVTRPGGLMVLSTLNRTAKSFALGVVGAEYILRWVPRGTHDWRKFRRPSELAGALRHAGAVVGDVTGVVYSPLTDEWRLSGDVSVNYMMVAAMPAAGKKRRR